MTAAVLDLTKAGPFQLERLVASRMLIQANSGGGKSWALRYLLEQTHGRIPHLVLDSEGEFSTLREKFDYVLAGRGGDVPADPKSAKVLCRRLVELGASAVVDLYDLKLDDRRSFVKLFLDEIMHLPRALWHPTLVVIDEAHRFCPERGSGDAQSTDAVITLCTQGRKRGYAAVLATQRLSKLHKDTAAELLNVLIGRTGLDVDAKRAGDILGMGKEARTALRDLAPGEFYAFGPAFSTAPTRIRTGAVRTTHPEPGKIGAIAPPAPAAVKKLLAQMEDLEEEAAEEEWTIADLEKRNRELQAEVRRARKESPAPDPAATQRQVDRAVKAEVATLQREAAAGERTLRGRVDMLERSISRGRAVAEKLVEALTIQPSANGGPSTKPAHLNRHSESSRAADSGPVVKQRAAKPTRKYSESIPGEMADGTPGDLSPRHHKVLNAAAALEALGVTPVDRGNLAVFAGYSPVSSGYEKTLSSLSSAGLVAYPSGGMVQLTDAGRDIAVAESLFEDLDGLHEAWSRKLAPREWRILRVLIDAYPDSLSREEVAERSEYSHSSSGFEKALSKLSSLGLATYPQRGYAAATDLLFPPGLT